MDLIILGMGPTRKDCPYDSEVWGVNNGYRQVAWHNRDRDKAQTELIRLQSLVPQSPEEAFANKETIGENERLLAAPKAKLDKLFICHRGQEYDQENDPIFDFGEINQLAQQGVEIVSLFNIKQLNLFTRYPYHQIVRKFGTNYFSDSIAYMLAYAIHINTRRVNGLLKLTESLRIRFYGADMHTQDEYATERGGIEYFIGVARTLGAEVWIHPDSSICQTANHKPYGFYRMDKKLIDPHNVLELQKSVKGLKKLLKRGVIDEVVFNEMSKYLEGRNVIS